MHGSATVSHERFLSDTERPPAVSSFTMITWLCHGGPSISKATRGNNMNSNSNFPLLNGSKRPRLATSPILPPSYDKFFQVKRLDGSFKEISPFIIHKSLQDFFGTLSSTKKLADGSLLIEVSSERQSDKAESLKKLHIYDVSTVKHPTLNEIKGVITCSDLANCTDDEILEGLSDQGVIKVFRIPPSKKFPDRKSSTFILSFCTHTLPESIKAGWYHIRVRQHIPNPLRCFKCQKFGHHSEKCSSPLYCPSCGHLAHEEGYCKTPANCVNCNGEHSPRYRGCPTYKKEFEIQKIRVQDKSSYPEAKRKFLLLNPSFSTTYSSKTKANKPTYKSIATQCDFSPLPPPQQNPPPIPPPSPSTSLPPSSSSPNIASPSSTPSSLPASISPPIRKIDFSNISRKSSLPTSIKKPDNSNSSNASSDPTGKIKHPSKQKSLKNSSKSSISSKESLSSDNMSLDLSISSDPPKSNKSNKRK